MESQKRFLQLSSVTLLVGIQNPLSVLHDLDFYPHLVNHLPVSMLIGSSDGVVAKLLACGARGSWYNSRSCCYGFRDWVSPASKLRYRYD